jgi:transmembrane sensor
MDKDFKTYQIEDFIQDEAFVSWVKTGHDPDLFWNDFIKNNPEKTEIMSNARQLVMALKFNEILPSQAQKEAGWMAVERKIGKKTNFRLLSWTMAIAASLALLFFIAPLFEGKLKEDTTGFAETQRVILPDGSIVVMNAKSQIKYKEVKFDGNREVYLEGEAFFEVKKGEKFVVRTPLGIVEVLGTSFNIFSRAGEMMVQCYTGKVAVNFNGMEDSYILTPGQQVSNQDKHQTKGFDLASDKNWRNGYFYFEETPLSAVLEELSRQYNLKEIKAASEVKNQLYTGYFQKGDLQAAIQSVCLPLQLEGRVSDSILILTRKNE